VAGPLEIVQLLSLVVAGVNKQSLSLRESRPSWAGEGEYDWPNAFGTEVPQ